MSNVRLTPIVVKDTSVHISNVKISTNVYKKLSRVDMVQVVTIYLVGISALVQHLQLVMRTILKDVKYHLENVLEANVYLQLQIHVKISNVVPTQYVGQKTIDQLAHVRQGSKETHSSYVIRFMLVQSLMIVQVIWFAFLAQNLVDAPKISSEKITIALRDLAIVQHQLCAAKTKNVSTLERKQVSVYVHMAINCFRTEIAEQSEYVKKMTHVLLEQFVEINLEVMNAFVRLILLEIRM